MTTSSKIKSDLPTPNSATEWFRYTFRETEYLFIKIKDTTFPHDVPTVSVLAHDAPYIHLTSLRCSAVFKGILAY